jgi:hypothetical protein
MKNGIGFMNLMVGLDAGNGVVLGAKWLNHKLRFPTCNPFPK